MTLPYPLLARGKYDTDMWIFFDTATPKRGVQLSHDIESVTCEDKAIKIYFKEEQGQFSLNSLQPSRARKLPILVSFPSKEDANTAFVGMAEQMAKETGKPFVERQSLTLSQTAKGRGFVSQTVALPLWLLSLKTELLFHLNSLNGHRAGNKTYTARQGNSRAIS